MSKNKYRATIVVEIESHIRPESAGDVLKHLESGWESNEILDFDIEEVKADG